MPQNNADTEDPRLLESERRYQAVIQNASDMIQSVLPDGTFEFVNQAWLNKLGYVQEEVPGLIIWDIIYPSSVEHCTEYFSKALRGDAIDYMQATFMTKDGQPVPVEGNVTSRFMGEAVVATHGFFRDISERLRAQDLEARNVELEREKRARYLEKMAALGKLSAGLAHELNNPAAAAQRASSRLEESLSRRDAAMGSIVTVGLEQDQWQLFDSHPVIGAAPDAARIRLDPIEISDLEVDIEDWLEAHDVDQGWEIAPALVEAGYTPAALDQFAEDMPAQALKAAVQRQAETQTVRELTSILARSSHRISELVAAVKGYSYMDRATEQQVDVHEGIEILGHRLRDISIKRSYDTTLPTVPVFGNSLNQVWTNILDNAIDATNGKGTISIRTRHVEDTAVIDLEDNGPGISAVDLGCIFEPFFTTKPQGQGTGLGLDTAWRIVTEEHGGMITVESKPGQTLFRITLPLVPRAPHTVSIQPSSAP
ncbi:MAG: two-component system sensor histidine kinase NtrB [Thermomicrobiales bacterium]